MWLKKQTTKTKQEISKSFGLNEAYQDSRNEEILKDLEDSEKWNLEMQDNTFIDNLTELRSRLIRCLVIIVVCFLCLIYFSNDIYQALAKPLQIFLPQNSSMIATEEASPF